jgi:hypothetical protein
MNLDAWLSPQTGEPMTFVQRRANRVPLSRIRMREENAKLDLKLALSFRMSLLGAANFIWRNT